MTESESRLEAISVGEIHGFEVAVVNADGETFSGKLSDLTLEEAAVGFPRGAGPMLPVGPLLTLVFTAPWLRTGIRVSARATSRVDSAALRNYRYRFEFESEELKQRLYREVQRVRNQRTAYRVEPASAEPVAVEIKLAADDPVHLPSGVQHAFNAFGHLKDISTSGVAVLLDPAGENVLAATDRLEVSFQLPPSSQRVQLTGWIRNRALRDGLVRYGLEYDSQCTADFEQQLEPIIKYIAHRQRQEKRPLEDQ